ERNLSKHLENRYKYRYAVSQLAYLLDVRPSTPSLHNLRCSFPSGTSDDFGEKYFLMEGGRPNVQSS
ncbi:MAG: hypothetical protein IJN33_00585, partial [Phascolarctobacterium sp.]|nr:hypothetical protein [Phascolarctobacterium sp.]